MKKSIKRLISAVLSLILLLQLAQTGIVLAAEEADRARNPAEQIELEVPAEISDGNYVFIRQGELTVSEKSTEKIYIPIQRTGDLSGEADVTVKIMNLTAREGVNYDLEVYKEDVEPDVYLTDEVYVDIFQNAYAQQEIPVADGEGLGEFLQETGGAALVNSYGEEIGVASAEPAQAEPQADSSAVAQLKAAGDAFAGTASDRQDMISESNPSAEPDPEATPLVDDIYPGLEYTLHFDPGDEARFLVLTPKYSEANDGPATVMILLKDVSEGWDLSEGYVMSNLTILDEDAPEPITFSMAADEIRAENGTASITVTREGRINSVVGVKLVSRDGSAAEGADYSGVGAKLWFPMGITERTVQLPVGAGEKEKDFYVSLVPLDNIDTVIGTETTRVIIPKGEVREPEAELTEDNPLYGEKWNLKNRTWFRTSRVNYTGDTSVEMKTTHDKEEVQWIQLHPDSGYAYDGVHIEFNAFTNFAKLKFYVKKNQNGWNLVYSKDYGDCSTKKGETADVYFNNPTAWSEFMIADQNYYNKDTLFHDDHTDVHVTAVYPIKRQFNITVQKPDKMDWLGESPSESSYTSFLVDNVDTSRVTKYAFDKFTISAVNGRECARMTGVVAVHPNDPTKTVSITTAKAEKAPDGTVTRTAEITLNEETIAMLVSGGFVRWTIESNGSYIGNLILKPLFEYLPITVHVTETDSDLGYLEYENAAGSWVRMNAGADYTFHIGDVPNFRTVVTDSSYRPAGLFYSEHLDASTGEYLDSGTKSMGEYNFLELDDEAYYKLTPTFTQFSNNMTVRVKTEDVAKFDTTRGLFVGAETRTVNGYTSFTVEKDILCNKVFALEARPKDEGAMAIWTVPGDSKPYSGEVFYHMSGPQVADNIITLGIETDPSKNAWYSVSGAVYTQEINLSTGHTTGVLTPVEQAVLVAPDTSAVAGEEGVFTIPPVFLSGDTRSRYLVSYNGAATIQEFIVPNAGLPKSDVEYYEMDGEEIVTLTRRAITVSNQYPAVRGFSSSGAHFTKVKVAQDGLNEGVVNTIMMNRQEVTITLDIASGLPYTKPDGTEAIENVKDVKLFFRNMYSGDIHGIYTTQSGPESNDPKVILSSDGKTATLTIKRFDADNEAKYTSGDALYAVLYTDRDTGFSNRGTEKEPNCVMAYDPVSTGYAVVPDPNYKPETFAMDPTKMLFLDTNPPGSDSEGRATYGKFPFLGEITLAISIFSVIKSAFTSKETEAILDRVDSMSDSTLTDLDDDDDLFSDEPEDAQLMGILPGKPSLSFAFRFRDTPYGGLRFMFAGVAMWNAGSSMSIAAADGTSNPYDSREFAMRTLSLIAEERNFAFLSGDLVKDTNLGNISGPYAKVGGFIGFYMDWGYIELQDGSGKLSHDLVLLGLGGFFGFQGAVGYTQHVLIVCVPAYFNGELGADITVFIGGSENPMMVLTDYQTQKHHNAQKWDLNVELYGNASVSLTVGVGFYKLLGARVTGALSVEAGYSNNMKDWFPGVGSNWGYSAGFSLSGTLDLIFASIPLGKFSWPALKKDGFIGYFSDVRKGNQLIKMIEQKPKNPPDETCRQKVQNLKNYIDSYSGTIKELGGMVGDLREYAYEHDIISYAQYWQSKYNMTGIAGSIMDAVLTEDEPEIKAPGFFIRDHVSPEWVAGDDASLMSAFGAVNTSLLETDALKHPNAKLLPIGGNRFLMVYLTDDPSRDRMQASRLMYSVFNASDDTWTDPKPVQSGVTADGKPNLIDAGDRLILSWSSIPDEKYEALKAEIAEELGVEKTDPRVIEAMEADPARVMLRMDIFSVEFDKERRQFGAIKQLTDDYYYDDDPQAAYDAETKDYIVMYIKTAQDDTLYDDQAQKLTDLVDPYTAERTYSVIAYRLYNGSKEADDPQPVGWVENYLYPNETDMTEAQQAAYFAEWGGQRFLRAAVRGLQDDPPIADLSVSTGYNGLAAYAFTVDTDLNVDTAEDKELYLKFYRFADHSTYVSIKVAGDQQMEQTVIPDDPTQSGYEIVTTDEQVEVGDPKLIRSGGSTWLFWRQNNERLKYLNISQLLNAQVATAVTPSSEADWAYDAEGWTWAVQDDGTFATDPITGTPYEPEILDVDFGGQTNSGDMNITEYQVVTDSEDNLYVVWTDTTLYEKEDGTPGTALEIYATAKIKHPVDVDEADSAPAAEWSKPYRLTRDNKYNDGVALALDGDDNLIVLHSQYALTDRSEDPAYLEELYNTIRVDEDGELFFSGDTINQMMVESPTNLMITHFAPIGAVEVGSFEFSTEHPVPGKPVAVTARIDNAGLTDAKGYSVDFYECKDGIRGRKIAAYSSGETLPVNTAREVGFTWTPTDVEGVSLLAVAVEEGYENTTETSSRTFDEKVQLAVRINEAIQNGDRFDVTYTVMNMGNKTAPAGTTADLRVMALYGDLTDRYGMEDAVVSSVALTKALEPGGSETVELTGENGISLPVSLFRFCGYDALQIDLTDPEGEVLSTSARYDISLNTPMHVTLNGGDDLSLAPGGSAEVQTDYETTAFMPQPRVIYSVDDPSVASVDDNGKVTAIRGGKTALKATLLPFGKSVSVPLRVDCSRDGTCPMAKFSDLDLDAWYHDGVHWALDEGIMNGVGGNRFAPDSATSRAMLVTMLWRREGAPKPEKPAAFKDVPEGMWYSDAIAWAAENGIVKGYSAEKFGPDDNLTREQIATILYRCAKARGEGFTGLWSYPLRYTDAQSVSGWAFEAMCWMDKIGVIQGVGDARLSPQGVATRAQVATMLMRFETAE